MEYGIIKTRCMATMARLLQPGLVRPQTASGNCIRRINISTMFEGNSYEAFISQRLCPSDLLSTHYRIFPQNLNL